MPGGMERSHASVSGCMGLRSYWRPMPNLSSLPLALAILCAAPSVVGAQDASGASADDAELDEASIEAARAAEEAEARQQFDDARLAFAEGRNEVALAAFQRAYELSGHPELLYNIGLVHDRLRNDREALASFEQYLEEVPAAENRVSVESRIRVLRESIEREDALAAAAASSGDRPSEEVWESPVFWTLIGIAVVGAGVGIGVGVALSQDPGTGPVMPGPSGVVIEALRF